MKYVIFEHEPSKKWWEGAIYQSTNDYELAKKIVDNFVTTTTEQLTLVAVLKVSD